MVAASAGHAAGLPARADVADGLLEPAGRRGRHGASAGPDRRRRRFGAAVGRRARDQGLPLRRPGLSRRRRRERHDALRRRSARSVPRLRLGKRAALLEGAHRRRNGRRQHDRPASRHQQDDARRLQPLRRRRPEQSAQRRLRREQSGHHRQLPGPGRPHGGNRADAVGLPRLAPRHLHASGRRCGPGRRHRGASRELRRRPRRPSGRHHHLHRSGRRRQPVGHHGRDLHPRQLGRAQRLFGLRRAGDPGHLARDEHPLRQVGRHAGGGSSGGLLPVRSGRGAQGGPGLSSE
ncbi:hypothetical protein D3C87_1253710 [compost metagenome]